MWLNHNEVLTLCVIAALVQPAFGGTDQIPPAAKSAINQVHRAAIAKDYDTLRKHMVAEFNWSFGGDASAEQAIAAWKMQSGYLRHLAKITQLRCTYRKDHYVECPVGAGTSFRAGFKETEGKWKMVYFVEGD
jgi:hypothetical protein